MRQTIKEIQVNVAYRWFLGLNMFDPVPHFSTFGKNYTRHFKDTDLFEQIFSHILDECYKAKVIDPSEVFVDATHVKARANYHKLVVKKSEQKALFYEEKLKEEINNDRVEHGKKPLKNKDDDDDPPSSGGSGRKEIKVSTSNPESGWFHKGEHKQVLQDLAIYEAISDHKKYGFRTESHMIIEAVRKMLNSKASDFDPDKLADLIAERLSGKLTATSITTNIKAENDEVPKEEAAYDAALSFLDNF